MDRGLRAPRCRPPPPRVLCVRCRDQHALALPLRCCYAAAAAGPTADIVRRAKAEVKRMLEEFTEKSMRREAPSTGRYSIV